MKEYIGHVIVMMSWLKTYNPQKYLDSQAYADNLIRVLYKDET